MLKNAASNYAITFACYNGIEFTKGCLASLRASDVDMTRVVVVDNCSTDGTKEFLEQYPDIRVIFNSENMGCGVAWNQGILHSQAEWTVVMNNDVVVRPSFIVPLMKLAKDYQVMALSPAMIEGRLEYDLQSTVDVWATEMLPYLRFEYAHLVCLLIHRSIFQNVGYFYPVPKLVGFEDTLFFNELRKSGFKLATAGGVWIHHFGSITQKIMKLQRGIRETDSLGSSSNKSFLNETFVTRKFKKYRAEKSVSASELFELSRYSRTVHGNFDNGAFTWRRGAVKKRSSPIAKVLPVDKVYVLSVKSFSDRIIHIKEQLSRQDIPFDFIFDYDVEDISSRERNRFADDYKLSLAHRSITLKHIRAWEKCIEHGYSRILVFEDDVILKERFVESLNFYLERLVGIDSYLLFLGGADTRVSVRELLFGDDIFERSIRTADAYITDLAACRKRLQWLKSHKIAQPADHLIVSIDCDAGVTQFWTDNYLAEQGSVFGLFDSKLDAFRGKHSSLFNRARYLFRKTKNRLLWIHLKRLIHLYKQLQLRWLS
jgi:glycosyltransferase involved in cell wall biosynthesis